MTDSNLRSDDLLHEVEQTARAQNRQPADIVAEAVRKYLKEQSWVEFVERNGREARDKRITEDDIDRLISDVRCENAQDNR